MGASTTVWSGKMATHNGYTAIRSSGKEEWLQQRRELGIGASEISAILGMNPYSASGKVFYDKIGLGKPFEGNVHTFMGNYYEASVAELWQYWDPAVGMQSVVDNFNSGKPVRKMRRINALLKSNDYPCLLATLDRRFQHNGKSAVLEIKTISGWEQDKWEHGVPLHYLYQIQQQLLVTGWEYAELCLQRDGRTLEVYDFEPSQPIFDAIIERGTEFWGRVTKAREILANGGTENDIQHLVPEPDGTPAYTEFMKERFRDKEACNAYIEADIKDYDLALEMIRLEQQKEAAEHAYEKVVQDIKARIGNLDGINFGEDFGRITWRPNAKNVRVFNKRSFNAHAMVKYNAPEVQEEGT